MESQSLQQHYEIAEFTRTRVFPMMDEFAAAKRLHYQMDSGVLVMLAKRLVYLGLDPAEIIELVADAVEDNEEQHQSNNNKNNERQAIGTSKVLPFVRREGK
jgi:hypothetical protein